jgi:hypothetical protein
MWSLVRSICVRATICLLAIGSELNVRERMAVAWFGTAPERGQRITSVTDSPRELVLSAVATSPPAAPGATGPPLSTRTLET